MGPIVLLGIAQGLSYACAPSVASQHAGLAVAHSATTMADAAVEQPYREETRIKQEPGYREETRYRERAPAYEMEEMKEPASEIRGNTQLQIGFGVISWSRSIEWDAPGNQDEREIDAVNILGGPALYGRGGGLGGGLGVASDLNFLLGYGLTETTVFGMHFGLGYNRSAVTNGDVESDLVAFQVAPALQYIFRPGEQGRPLIQARFGVAGSYSDNRPSTEERFRSVVVGPLVGVGIGGQYWMTEHVAFQGTVDANYAPFWATTREETPSTDVDDNFDKLSHDVTVVLHLGVGFSI